MKTLPTLLVCASLALAQAPGTRVLLDAHNCYPEHSKWGDRIERALATGLPVAIEQDLFWYRDEATGRAWSVVAHNKPISGKEPTMKEHFFERIRPHMDRALKENKPEKWPLVVLNLDFKTDEEEHHRAVWALLEQYRGWLATAPRTATQSRVEPLSKGPLLVLTGSAESQERDFHDVVPLGGRLLLFGAARVVAGSNGDTRPEWMVPQRADNYRRWWNNPWSVVERGGQPESGEWTSDDDERLRALTKHAHDFGYWLRFYTLNGTTPAESEANGWGRGYNFGSLGAARKRWQASIAAGVDFIATDQYEDLAKELRRR